MDGTDLHAALRDAISELQDATGCYASDGIKAARAERAYREALAKAMLARRADGMPATLTPDVARGDVAALKEERDCTAAVFDADREVINTCKTVIRVTEAMIDREWRS